MLACPSQRETFIIGTPFPSRSLANVWRSYELLLNVSSSFLEDVQATALATAQAVAEGDAAIGRRAALAEAAVGLWMASYGSGLMEGRSDGAGPRFVEV